MADICFDYSAQTYGEAVGACGSVEDLYMAYFDRQFEMIQAVRPFVVGHFDLVRSRKTIIDAHLLYLSDTFLKKKISMAIKDNVSAEYALKKVVFEYVDM